MAHNPQPAKRYRHDSDQIFDAGSFELYIMDIKDRPFSWYAGRELRPFFEECGTLDEASDDKQADGLVSKADPFENSSFVLLRPEYRKAFIKIVNYLDVASFMKLCLVSKELHKFCMTTEGIEVHLWKGEVTASDDKFDLKCNDCHHKSNRPYNHSTTEIFRQKPFVFHLSSLSLKDLDPCTTQDLADLRLFLEGIRAKSVHALRTYGKVDLSKCSQEFVQFLKDMKVERIVAKTKFPEEVMAYIVQNVNSFESDRNIDDRFIAEATISKMELKESNIRQTTLTSIIQKWADGVSNIDFWQIGASFAFYPFQTIFTTLDFDHDGPLPDVRPLIFHRQSVIYVLRADHKILSISFQLPMLTLRSCELHSYPPAVKKVLAGSD